MLSLLANLSIGSLVAIGEVRRRRAAVPARWASGTSRTTASASSRSAGARAARCRAGFIALRRRGRLPAATCCAAACTSSCRSSTASTRMPLVTIPQGKIGYVFARDGAAARADADARPSNVDAPTTSRTSPAFLRARRAARAAAQDPARGHLRDQPRAVRRHHRRARSTSCRSTGGRATMFQPHGRSSSPSATASRRWCIKGADDLVGIVTVHDGPSLPQGEIIAPVGGRRPGGRARPTTTTSRTRSASSPPAGVRGRQLQVLVEGTYYINRLFATVEMIPKTVDRGRHGRRRRLVHRRARGATSRATSTSTASWSSTGARGVWSEPLLPGKYAFNTYAGKVIVGADDQLHPEVEPQRRSGSHQLRREPVRGLAHHQGRVRAVAAAVGGRAHRLPEGAAGHPALRRHQAPRRADARPDGVGVLQERRRRRARSSSCIQERSEIQQRRGRGDEGEVRALQPRARGGADRHADERAEGDTRDRDDPHAAARAADRRGAGRDLRAPGEGGREGARAARGRGARAAAAGAHRVARSSITVQANQGKAEYQRSLQQAAQIRALAEAEAEKAARIGIGQAIAIEEQVRAYGGPQFQVTQQVMNRFAEAIEKARVDVVPRIVIGGGGGGGGAGGVAGGQRARGAPDAALVGQDGRQRGDAAGGAARSGRAPSAHPRRADGQPGEGAVTARRLSLAAPAHVHSPHFHSPHFTLRTFTPALSLSALSLSALSLSALSLSALRSPHFHSPRVHSRGSNSRRPAPATCVARALRQHAHCSRSTLAFRAGALAGGRRLR